MKDKKLKGFTLIELIVVMAIFSILMVGALALVDPVSRINKSASDFERTYAYVDNIQDYMQDSLRYAENVWVYQGNSVDLLDEVNKFKNSYYKGIVNTKDGVNTVYTKGNIRIMTILNQDEKDGGGNVKTDSHGNKLCKGQILMSMVDFDSDHSNESDLDDVSNTIISTDIGEAVAQLNPDFFSKDFSFNYILGASQLVNTGHDTAKVEDITKGHSLNFENFSIGVVTYDNIEYAKLASPDPAEYPFTCQYSVATIPLVNIINRNGNPVKYYIYDKKQATDAMGNPRFHADGVTPLMEVDKSKIVAQSVITSSFQASSSDISNNPDDNIYIIYTLGDEVNIAK
ncbi:MAG: type II secretion system GspH family protein [Oscillospiraceae bacterium]|nr:type II secretion system GspH family protein [Oscillospiraceae bacterium]